MSSSEGEQEEASTPASAPDGETLPNTVSIVYEHAPNYKTAHADGAQGGFTPEGYLFVSFYNDRPALPDRTEHDVTEEGTLGDATPSDDSDVILERSREFGVFLDAETLQEIHAWLGQKIELLKQAQPSDEA